MAFASSQDSGCPGSDAETPVPQGVPSRWMARVVEATGAEPVADSDEGAPPPRSVEEPSCWQQVLEQACAEHALRLRPVFLSAREAFGAAGARTPLVRHVAREGGPGWLALLDRVRGRVRVATGDGGERWLDPGGLAAALGQPGPDSACPWLLVESRQPVGQVSKPLSAAHRIPPLRRLIGLVKPDRTDLSSIVLYAILIGALSLTTPIAVQQLVNTVAFGGLVQPVVVLALLLFGGLAFSALVSVLQAYTAEKIQRRVFVRVAMDLAERVPRVDLGAFDTKHGPELVNRIFDVFTVQKTGAALLLEGTSVVLQTVVGLVVLSFYHPLMLGFSILLVAGIAVVLVVFGRGAVETAIGESSTKYAVVGWMEELARHPGAFRDPGGRQYALERVDRLASAWVGARQRHYRVVLRQLSGSLGLQVLAGSALLALGGGLVVAGQLTLGQLVASELILTAIVSAVAKLGKQLESYYDLLAAVDKLGVLFDLPLERDGGSAPAANEGPAAVEIRELDFSYGSRPVVSKLSLKVDPGERLLITGPAGAGRTTLLELIQGLREPQAGFIAIDGQDLRDLRLGELRDQVVCVHDPEIFAGSVLDNIRVTAPGLSTSRVDQTLESLGVLESIRALPEGLRTPLATDGAPLSDGLIAAIMLARAIVARPRLLLLDDAFVQLEGETRGRALDTVFAPDAPWTLIVSSEKPEVRARCTRIIALPHGADEEPAAC